MSFSMIIHNVTILPSLSTKIAATLAFATMGLGGCMIYMLFDFQSKQSKKLMRRIKDEVKTKLNK
ncbi:MAG: hypothetical protein IIC76_15390 [Bacteroidetes bacterium]|nr:hypothetical protein [Bacteroidota bacterium]